MELDNQYLYLTSNCFREIFPENTSHTLKNIIQSLAHGYPLDYAVALVNFLHSKYLYSCVQLEFLAYWDKWQTCNLIDNLNENFAIQFFFFLKYGTSRSDSRELSHICDLNVKFDENKRYLFSNAFPLRMCPSTITDTIRKYALPSWPMTSDALIFNIISIAIYYYL